MFGRLFPEDDAILLLVYESNASKTKEITFPLSVLETFHQIWITISAFALFFNLSKGLSEIEDPLVELVVTLSSAVRASRFFNSC